jgi:hypothetical protein
MTSRSVQVPLRRLHSDATMEFGNRSSFLYWSSKSTDEIVRSLSPGSNEPLIVKGDGTVMQGNTRIMVLERRGVTVDSLPRVSFP